MRCERKILATSSPAFLTFVCVDCTVMKPEPFGESQTWVQYQVFMRTNRKIRRRHSSRAVQAGHIRQDAAWYQFRQFLLALESR
jgi:hypothetical protein